MPAIMKGYIDRVMSYGFGYRYNQGVQEGLLKNKQAVILNTQDKSHAEYETPGMDKALSLTADTGIFIYWGLDIRRHFFFDKAEKATADDLIKWSAAIRNLFATDAEPAYT